MIGGRFILCEKRKVDFTANAKVNTDIIKILQREGFQSLHVRRFYLPIRGTQKILSVCWWLYSRFVLMRLPRNSTVVMQYPNGCARWERCAPQFFKGIANKAKLVLLVQDLDVPRFDGDEVVDSEDVPVVRIAKIANKVIVHNAVMRQWFVDRGVTDSKIIELSTFDYLATPELKQAEFSRVVTVAGNLAPNKAAYAAHLREIEGVQWRIFSPYFDEVTMGGANIKYAGVCPAEEFPALLNSGFGLVWDGDSIDGCTGNAGRYTLMVSPHKFALYLASGLPVIVSADAAIARFVQDNDVGILVKSLRDLPNELAAISETRYLELARNALNVGQKLRSGYFTKKAITSALVEASK